MSMTERDLAGGFSEGALEEEGRERQQELEEERDRFERWLTSRAKLATICARGPDGYGHWRNVREILADVAREGARLHVLLQETSR